MDGDGGGRYHSGMLRLATPVFAITAILTTTRCRISLRMVVLAMFLCTKCFYNDPAN